MATRWNPLEKHIRIFVDPVSFFCKYSATTALSNSLGHVTKVLCMLCNVSSTKETQGGEIPYNSMVHSRRVVYARTDRRLEAIRAGSIHSRILHRMGINSGDEKYIGNYILLACRVK